MLLLNHFRQLAWFPGRGVSCSNACILVPVLQAHSAVNYSFLNVNDVSDLLKKGLRSDSQLQLCLTLLGLLYWMLKKLVNMHHKQKERSLKLAVMGSSEASPGTSIQFEVEQLVGRLQQVAVEVQQLKTCLGKCRTVQEQQAVSGIHPLHCTCEHKQSAILTRRSARKHICCNL